MFQTSNNIALLIKIYKFYLKQCTQNTLKFEKEVNNIAQTLFGFLKMKTGGKEVKKKKKKSTQKNQNFKMFGQTILHSVSWWNLQRAKHGTKVGKKKKRLCS